MRKNKLFLMIGIFVLIFLVGVVSATERMPTVGGDDGTWAGILNDFLNVSLNDSGQLGNNTVASLQILNDSIVDDDISDITNLTLGEKITFALGEIIDNIVNGWISITGSLNVSGSLNVAGDIISNGINISNWQTNVSRNWTQQVFDEWNSDWSSIDESLDDSD